MAVVGLAMSGTEHTRPVEMRVVLTPQVRELSRLAREAQRIEGAIAEWAKRYGVEPDNLYESFLAGKIPWGDPELQLLLEQSEVVADQLAEFVAGSRG